MKNQSFRPVARDDELDGARTGVAAGPGRVAGGGAHRRTLPRGEQWRRRLLDDLLVPALQGALPLAEVDHVAVGVGQDLDLDVPRGGDQALDEQGVVAERAARLAPGRREGVGEGVGTVDLPHALPAAAGRRFEQHRIADPGDGPRQLGVREPGAVRPRHDRDAGRGHRPLGPDLVAHRLDRLGRRADEGDPGLRAGRGERGVLAQEAVAGVDRLRARRPRRRDHPVDRQVALRRGRRPEPDRDVGRAHVRRVHVGVGVHRDRADPQGAQRADHPERDLPAVGDEHSGEHSRHIRKTPKAGSPSGALAAAESASPSTVRVSAGSITPSSHSRAVE